MGWGLLLGSLSQQVQVDEVGREATYPALAAPGVADPLGRCRAPRTPLHQPRGPGVLPSRRGDRVLLPMRVSRFQELVALVGHHTAE
ncbi:hypothetical protein NW841_05345 [Synechococcus sp. H60.3]|uniref:hypothetical protein n=1 Tax=unclassified Synechococcus TaxID=2626047 RepID=UPI0039C33749